MRVDPKVVKCIVLVVLVVNDCERILFDLKAIFIVIPCSSCRISVIEDEVLDEAYMWQISGDDQETSGESEGVWISAGISGARVTIINHALELDVFLNVGTKLFHVE